MVTIAKPTSLQTVLDVELAVIDTPNIDVHSLDRAFRNMITAIDSRLLYVQQFAIVDSHEAEANLETIKAAVFALREKYLPNVKTFVVPSVMAVWEICVSMYGKVDNIQTLYNWNKIRNPNAVAVGTVIIGPEK